MKLCDVCEELLFNPTCDECGFDNSYQYEQIDIMSILLEYFTIYPDATLEDIEEAIGLERETIISLLNEIEEEM